MSSLELSPHRVADASLQRAERFLARLAFGELAVVVGAAGRGVRDLGDRDEMHRVVQFPVPTRVEPMTDARSARRFDRRGAVVGREPGSGREPGRVTDVSEDQAGDDRADTMQFEQRGVRLARPRPRCAL